MKIILVGLFLLLILSVIFSNKIVALLAVAAIYFQEMWLPQERQSGTDEVKYDMCDMCGPTDPFNTYENSDFSKDVDREFAEYKALTEYPREIADEIPQAFSKGAMTSADDYCARAQRNTQMKANEAIVNRARLNVNTFRPYFEDEMASAESAQWWNVDQASYLA